MTESFEQFSLGLIRHYAALVRRYPEQNAAWRAQTEKLEKEHPEVWAGLTDKVRAAVKGQA